MTTVLPRREAIWVFLAFAAAYFFSALVRAVTATLAPTLTQELSLSAGDLGLLAGAFFLGFSALQAPMGLWLDRFGPRRVEVWFLTLAVIGCIIFSQADSFEGLLVARLLCGAGFAACLMAPLTGYRRWYSAATQLRANSWMLMTGSFGMLASTLPVQWLMPWIGWRGMFVGLALLILVAAALILWRVPAWQAPSSVAEEHPSDEGYAAVWRHPYFRSLMPMGFFCYGGFLAVQTLWAGPWLVRVVGATPLESALGLFLINLCMLCTFWGWGVFNPYLLRRGWSANRLMLWGVPTSFFVLLANILLGPAGGWWGWALYCMTCSFVTLAQPSIGLAFPPAFAGRALSAFNLVLFSGVFVVQWGIGILVDGFKSAQISEIMAFQLAMSVLLVCSVCSYLWFAHTIKECSA